MKKMVDKIKVENGMVVEVEMINADFPMGKKLVGDGTVSLENYLNSAKGMCKDFGWDYEYTVL